MLYLEDGRRELWPQVTRALTSMGHLDMVLCLYEGSGPNDFFAPFLAPEKEDFLEPVPPADENAVPKCSRRVAVDDEFLSWLEQHTLDFEDWGHALALYRPRKYELIAAVIPHKGIILVADEFGSDLAAAGFLLSDETPDWWGDV